MRLGLIALVGLAVIMAPIGFFSFGLLLKLGITESVALYGMPFTLALCFAAASCLVVLGFLFDRREPRNQDFPKDWQ